jgi:peptide/nickel transport system permease protein
VAIYILKRVLLMFPTFFVISLLVFVVLNFAPGNPGADILGAGDGGQSASLAGQQNESYRLFKQQFNLDKPVLFNTRFGLTTEDVEAVAEADVNLSGTVSAKERSEAQETIDNWGHYAIPALIDLLQNHPERRVRSYAALRLASGAQRALINQYSGGRLTPEEKKLNDEIYAENNTIRRWTFGPAAGEQREQEVRGNWVEWHRTNASRWDWSAASTKLRIFLFDTRFAKYWSNLIRLDFGVSHVDKRPVFQTVMSKLKYSITLSFSSVILVYLLSVPLGIWSAVKQNTLADRTVTVLLFMMYSLPSFFVGVFLLNLLTRGTPWQAFPTSGFQSLDVSGMTTLEYIGDVLHHIALPILCLSYASLAVLSRYARTGLLDVIRADYIRTARAKGLPESIVIVKHAARNGMIPIITLLATLLPTLIGGSVVIEVIFGIPGMGLFMFDSITIRDYNAVMAVLLISSSLTLVGMLFADIAYVLVDPRITFD